MAEEETKTNKIITGLKQAISHIKEENKNNVKYHIIKVPDRKCSNITKE